MTFDDVDELAPVHQRTSCERREGNEYANEAGYVRCVRCALLFRVKNGHWPNDATPMIGSIQLIGGHEE